MCRLIFTLLAVLTVFVLASASILEDMCGANQTYLLCGTKGGGNVCSATCDNLDIKCPKVCTAGCHCIRGYVKNANGDCISPDDC